MAEHFADAVLEQCRQKESRLVVGIDPHWHLIPDSFKANYDGGDPSAVVSDYFCQVVESTAHVAVAFKPQIAFFEQFGPNGLEALNDVLARIRRHGGLVIMDAKRNDIGSTAAAYGRAFFGTEDFPPGFPSDALTVNGYLGTDGIVPFLESKTKGLFVLVKTSNPGSAQFQDREFADGTTLAEAMADAVAQWNADTLGHSGYGLVGAVVGATYPEHMRKLRGRMPHSLLLVPGYGAQGGSGEAVKAAMNGDGFGGLINSSRGICFPAEYEQKGFEAISHAAEQARSDIARLLNS